MEEIADTRRILQELNQSLSEFKKETKKLLVDDKHLSSHISVRKKPPVDKKATSTSAWAKSSTARGSHHRTQQQGWSSAQKTKKTPEKEGDVMRATNFIRQNGPSISFGSASARPASLANKRPDHADVASKLDVKDTLLRKRTRGITSMHPPSVETTRIKPKLPTEAQLEAGVPLSTALEPQKLQQPILSLNPKKDLTEPNPRSFHFGSAPQRVSIVNNYSCLSENEKDNSKDNKPAMLDVAAADKFLRCYERPRSIKFHPSDEETSARRFRYDQSNHESSRTIRSSWKEGSMRSSSSSSPMYKRNRKDPIRQAVVETLTHMIARIDGSNDLNAVRDLITKWKQPIVESSQKPAPISSSLSTDVMKSIDNLSTKSRTAYVSIRPDMSLSRKPTPESLCDEAFRGIENEAHLQDSSPILMPAFGADTRGGRVYHPHASVAPDKKSVQIAREHNRSVLPGPGYYDTDVSFNSTRKNRRAVMMRPPSDEAEKNTHVMRKRYFEEKARDAREEHDYMRQTNDDFLHPRVRAAQIIPESKSSQPTLQNSHDSDRVSFVKSLLEAEDIVTPSDKEQMPVDTSTINYNLTEKVPLMKVNMDREVKSRQEVKEMIASKPGVLQAMIQKKQAETLRSNRYYGPQLQVPWGVKSTKDANKLSAETDDSDDSMDELLHEVQETRKSVSTSLNQGEGNLTGHKLIEEEDPSTAAYLASIYGAPRVQTVTMRPPTAPNRPLEKHTDFDYIGPQLPIDWKKAGEAKTTNSVSMGIAVGRDQVKVMKKGHALNIPFNATADVLPKTSMGPGQYDVMGDMRIGEGVKGMIDFNKGISRHDQVGPRGEKAQSAVDLEEEEERLDLDPHSALEALKVDKRKEGMKLYRRQRHEEKKLDDVAQKAIDHIGGAWFKGLAEEIEASKPVVNFDKMAGRSQFDDFDEDDSDVDNSGREGQRLDLNEDRWLVVKPKPPSTHVMGPNKSKNPEEYEEWLKRYPRFEVKKTEDTPEPPSPTALNDAKDRMLKKVSHVNMGAQLGRDDRTKEDEMLLEEFDDAPDKDIAIEIEKEREEKMKAAKEGKSSKKGVSMDKQLGRAELEKREAKPSGAPSKHEDVTNGFEFLKPNRNQHNDWSKVKGRSIHEPDVDDELEEDNVELDLEPNLDLKYKRLRETPDWSKVVNERAKVDVSKIIEEELGTGGELELNVNTNPIDKRVKGATTMHAPVSRKIPPKEDNDSKEKGQNTSKNRDEKWKKMEEKRKKMEEKRKNKGKKEPTSSKEDEHQSLPSNVFNETSLERVNDSDINELKLGEMDLGGDDLGQGAETWSPLKNFKANTPQGIPFNLDGVERRMEENEAFGKEDNGHHEGVAEGEHPIASERASSWNKIKTPDGVDDKELDGDVQ